MDDMKYEENCICKEEPDTVKISLKKYLAFEVWTIVFRWLLRHGIMAGLVAALNSIGAYDGSAIWKIMLTVVSWWISREVYSCIAYDICGMDTNESKMKGFGSTFESIKELVEDIRIYK